MSPFPDFDFGHHQSLLNASASEGTRRRRARRSVVFPQLSGPTTNNACRFEILLAVLPRIYYTTRREWDKSWINYQTQRRLKKKTFFSSKKCCGETRKQQPTSQSPWILGIFDFFFCTLPASNLNEHSEMAGDKFVEYLLQQGMNPHPSWLVFCQSVRQKGTSDIFKWFKKGTQPTNQSAIVQGIATQSS